MFEIIIIALCIGLNLFALFGILLQADDDFKTGALMGIKEFVCELFYDRNCFGMLLSAVVLILLVPAILMVIATQIIFWIGMALGYIYNLGNKKIS